jgi:hypothetical protein
MAERIKWRESMPCKFILQVNQKKFTEPFASPIQQLSGLQSWAGSVRTAYTSSRVLVFNLRKQTEG